METCANDPNYLRGSTRLPEIFSVFTPHCRRLPPQGVDPSNQQILLAFYLNVRHFIAPVANPVLWTMICGATAREYGLSQKITGSEEDHFVAGPHSPIPDMPSLTKGCVARALPGLLP
jgi:hypothetical protein